MSENFIEKLKTPENKSYEDRMRKALSMIGVEISKDIFDVLAMPVIRSSKYRESDSESYAKIVFDIILDKSYPDILEILKDKLSNELIVDLGCGVCPENTLSGLQKIGVSSYIGVDKFNAKENYFIENQTKERFNIDGIYIPEDMLRFVKILPDESVNYLMNGIDDLIISNNEYKEELSKEVWRTTKKNGVVFGLCSSLLKNDFSDIIPEALKFKLASTMTDQFFIYQKKI